jgi:hypothetical protein
MSRFARFVAIDWSGAKGTRQSGIQVAVAEAESADCRLVQPSQGGHWSRLDVIDYIVGLDDRPTVVGIDFAFSVPWDDELLGPHRIGGVRQLWALVESLCESTPDLYAGPVWTATESPFRPYIFHHQSGHRGERYRRNNLRKVDDVEGNAISIYHMTGTQVGAGSFSGMRMLHRIATSHGDKVAIWPFDAIEGRKTAIVEIYPSFFYRQAGVRRPRRPDLLASNYDALDKALGFYGGRRRRGLACRSVDQADALVAAAALRKLADGAAFAAFETIGFDRREGWIFGVSPASLGKTDPGKTGLGKADRDLRRDAAAAAFPVLTARP